MTDTPRIFPKGGRPQGLLGFSRIQPELKDTVAGIFAKYPPLAAHQGDYAVYQGRPMVPGDDRQLESYPTDETWNPIPGSATTEVYNNQVSQPEQENLIAGDMLHHLAMVDPQWAAMKKDVVPPEMQADPNVYHSRGDEFLMGYLTPDKADQWKGSYTPEQKAKLDRMLQYLLSGQQ